MDNREFRIGVLASGAGTTLQAVIDACDSGALPARVVAIISNNSRCGAAARASTHGIRFAHLSGRTHPDPERLDAAIRDVLTDVCADLVLLAGYMKKIGPKTLAAFAGRIVNTHPSLLPEFGGRGMYGARVHAAVLEAGAEQTGVSVHLVDGDYDTGPVLARRVVPVEPGDDVQSLARRVQGAERPFLIEVLCRIVRGDIAWPAAAGR
jgi:phosphoribosylglycinamide formyltransferase 1